MNFPNYLCANKIKKNAQESKHTHFEWQMYDCKDYLKEYVNKEVKILCITVFNFKQSSLCTCIIVLYITVYIIYTCNLCNTMCIYVGRTRLKKIYICCHLHEKKNVNYTLNWRFNFFDGVKKYNMYENHLEFLPYFVIKYDLIIIPVIKKI